MPKWRQAEFRIRDYRPEDFPRLLEIDHICFAADVAYSRAELLFFLKHRESITRVAELEDKIAGFAVGRGENDLSAHIITLDVIPEARRRGIGTELMNALHETFQARNVPMTFLEVDSTDRGAQRFYRQLEYVAVETIPGYYRNRDAVRMVRFAPKEAASFPWPDTPSESES